MGCMGSELYNRKEDIKGYIGAETRFAYNKYLVQQFVKGILKNIISGKKYIRINEIPDEIFKRVTYCLTDIYEECVLAQKVFKKEFTWIWYNYYNIEDTLGNLKDRFVDGNNILLGNSSSMTNNHLESIRLLEKFDLGKRKLITPLSYGEGYYRKIILKKGMRSFGDHFHPLIEYLDREAYNKYVLSCNITIMNHYRPQALGNIITALWLGSKVYLNKRNIIFTYLTRLGIKISSVEDDLRTDNPDALNSPDPGIAEHNREILYREYGKDNVLIKVQKVVDLLSK